MEARKRTRADRHDGHLMEAPQWSLAMEARKSVLPSSPPVLMVSPQWSLAMEAGKGSPIGQSVGVGGLPAMEPGHGGQEEHGPSPSALVGSRGARNGAWPWRPGRGRLVTLTADAGLTSRNGAWPWRPGRGSTAWDRVWYVKANAPAMEPGHGGQEEDRHGATTPVRIRRRAGHGGRRGRAPLGGSMTLGPQWSLAMEARKNSAGWDTHGAVRNRGRRNGAWPWRPGRVAAICHGAVRAAHASPQWSLAMEARKSPSPVVRTRDGSRNGAWPWRPGRDGRGARHGVIIDGPRRCRPAMEPGHGGQEEARQRGPVHATAANAPAMEPGHGGQEETRAADRWRNSAPTRNGAWPWRPGRATV